jgi:hypothetical protein
MPTRTFSLESYVILVIGMIFVLEWFQIVDVPFFEIPDLLSRKKNMIRSTESGKLQVARFGDQCIWN